LRRQRRLAESAGASTPETEYGWIEPGETFGRIESDRVLQVKRFWEKPSEAQARSLPGRRPSVEHVRYRGETINPPINSAQI
jgi:hypothetical protein